MSFSTACVREVIIEKPVIQEVIVTEWRDVPADLLVKHNPATIPETATYSDALQLWSADRQMQLLPGQFFYPVQ